MSTRKSLEREKPLSVTGIQGTEFIKQLASKLPPHDQEAPDGMAHVTRRTTFVSVYERRSSSISTSRCGLSRDRNGKLLRPSIPGNGDDNADSWTAQLRTKQEK